jgi:hypothetical protein
MNEAWSCVVVVSCGGGRRLEEDAVGKLHFD